MNRDKPNTEEQELLRALRTLALEEKGLATPSRVEGQLMRAFDEARGGTSSHRRGFAPHALKAAAVFVVAAVGGYWLSGRTEPPPGEVVRPEPVVTMPWPSPEALAWLDPEPGSLQIVHVRVASATLAAQGYTVGDPDGDGLVDIQMIVGDDGLARGIRVTSATAVTY